MGTMHGIINTASASTSMHSYLALLKPKGKMILVGLPEKPLQIPTFALVGGNLLVCPTLHRLIPSQIHGKI